MTEPPQHPIIELRNLWRSFNGLHVLRGIDLAVAPGSSTVVIGASGCGKSVLLKHITGLLKPDAGSVLFDGRDITHLSERELTDVRRRIGMVFQNGALFDSMNVEDNVCFPLREQGTCGSDECRERCREALRIVGLDGAQRKMPEELSGGQRKRVALARAIVIRPEVILYDEPTTGLDPIRADLINELILRLQDTLGTTAVVVTHDIAAARRVADRIVMLHEGRFIADGSPASLEDTDDDRVRRFLAGKANAEELAGLEGAYLASSPPDEETRDTSASHSATRGGVTQDR